MAIEVFTITKIPKATTASSNAKDGRLELVQFADIQNATHFALVSLPRAMKFSTSLIACFLEHDDVSNSKKSELRRTLNTINKHINELESIRIHSRKLLANLDDARMFFLLSYNALIKLDDPTFNPHNIHESYQRDIETFRRTLEQSERPVKRFADNFERVHQSYADELFEQYQKIMLPSASLYGDKVSARLNRVRSYLDPEGTLSQDGKFLHGAFVHTTRYNIVTELRNVSSVLEADARSTLFSDIPGVSQQLLALSGFILNAVIALGTINAENLDDDEKTRIGDLQIVLTRLFTVDFPQLHLSTVAGVIAGTEDRFRKFETVLTDDPSHPDTVIDNALKALWEVDLARLAQNSKKLSKNEEEFYLSLEIQKIKTLLAQNKQAYNRGAFLELVRFFLDKARVGENLALAGTNTQYFAISPYLYPKELLPTLISMRIHSNACIMIMQQLHEFLLNIIRTVEAQSPLTWFDRLSSAQERKAKVALHENSLSLKKRITANCYEFLTRFIAIESQHDNLFFSSEADYNNRCRLFVLAEPPIDYTKDALGRKKVIIALRNPIEINILILCLKYYNYLAKIRDTRIYNTKLEIVSLNSQDLNHESKLADLNVRLGNVFVSAKSTQLTQFLFIIDEVYLIGGCVREVDKNYKLILLDGYQPGTIPKLLYNWINKICTHFGIIFDSFVTMPQFGANCGLAAIEAVAYLSRQDFQHPALMTSDNNDGFTIINLSRHMRRLQGGHIFGDVAAAMSTQTGPIGSGITVQLAQLDQCMAAFNTSDRIYRLGLRNRWAKLIKTALQDSDFKTHTDAGKAFQATITSVTLAPPIENPTLTSVINRLNFFPLVPPAAIERMEAQCHMQIEEELRAAKVAATKISAPTLSSASSISVPNPSVLATSIATALATPTAPATTSRTPATTPSVPSATAGPLHRSSFKAWFSRRKSK